MINAGIHSGDILIVDRSLEPYSGRIVVAVLDGEFTIKRLCRRQGRVFLESANPQYRPIEVGSDTDLNIWGVVAHVIHSVG